MRRKRERGPRANLELVLWALGRRLLCNTTPPLDELYLRHFRGARALASLEHILNEVRTGHGILHELIYTETTEQDLIVEVLEAGARLNSILAKIDRGEGSLGLLLNDPTLYEDLKILVGGAQRSTVVRSLIRMAVEAGDDP